MVFCYETLSGSRPFESWVVLTRRVERVVHLRLMLVSSIEVVGAVYMEKPLVVVAD